MMSTECHECGEAVPLLARTCGHCGAPNPARLGVIAVAAGLVALIAAAAGAVYMATRSPAEVTADGTPAAATEAPAAPQGMPVQAPAATAASDFAWLKSAMTACDQAAAKQSAAAYFLVIPLTADAKDMADWRLIAVGSIGNALTIPGNDALGGLRSGKLKLYPDEYVFGVQDAASRRAYKWGVSTGAKQFSTTDVAQAKTFRMQLQPRRKTDDTDWGDTYPRQGGDCHWVAAIVRG
jgi:hypothetical protein